MPVTIPVGSKVLVTAVFKDSAGNPIAPQPSSGVQWPASNSLVTIQPVESSNTAWITPIGPLGTTTITAEFSTIFGSFDVTVVPGPATQLGFSFGPIVPV